MRFIFNVFICFSIFISSQSFSSEGVIENTPISTPSGVKSIQDITTADTVISCDTSSMECRENKVLINSTCIYTDVIKITTGAGRELSLALEQQVFIEAKGWLTGDKLELYDCLIDINGYQDYIVAIEPSEHKQPVYIFAVARDHNFYADGILVHNPGWGDLFGAVGGAIANSFAPDCEARSKGSSGKKYSSTKQTVNVTSRAARREANRQEGIPTSQQPDSQSKNASGYEYRYTLPAPLGTTKTKSVQDQTLDISHLGQGHWEAGEVKINKVNGKIEMNKYGRPKLPNSKTKVDYDN